MKTITRDQFYLAGLQRILRVQDGGIPSLWGEFFQRRPELTNETNKGVCYGFSSECDPATGQMTYLAAAEVTDLDHLPERFVGRTIPAGTYAMITHKGSFDGLRDTWDRAYSELLPKAGLVPAGEYAFERMDERSDMSLPEPEVEIYIPVQSS